MGESQRIAELEEAVAIAATALRGAATVLEEREKQVAALRSVLLDQESKLVEVWGKEEAAHALAYGWVKPRIDAILADTASAGECYVDIDGEEMRALLYDAWGNGRGNGKDRDGAKLIADFKKRRGVAIRVEARRGDG